MRGFLAAAFANALTVAGTLSLCTGLCEPDRSSKSTIDGSSASSSTNPAWIVIG